MATKDFSNTIAEDIKNAAPAFEPAHALTALENTNVYLFRYFPKLKMIVATEKLCRDFQLQAVYHDMPESFSRDFVSERDRERFEKMYHDIDAGAPSVSVDFQGISHKIWCHVTMTTVEWDSDHRPELCTGVVEDLTKEKLSKDELDSILSSISCGILQYRRSDYKLLRANTAALEILGYESLEDIAADMEKGVARTVVAEDRLYIRTMADSLQNSGEMKIVEYRVKRKDSDQLRYCYGTIQTYDNIYGERIIQRTIMDITDRKLREDMQQVNNDLVQRLDTVLSGISGGFEITLDDPDFTYTFLSESVAALQGYTVEELLEECHGKGVENIYPEDREYVEECLSNIPPDSNSYNIKYRLRHKSGKLIWVLETGKKVIDPSGTSMIYSLIQDITESEKRTAEISHLLTMQKQMVTSLGCGVMAYTVPEHKSLILNKELRRIFHYQDNDPRPMVKVIMDSLPSEEQTAVHEIISHLQQVGDTRTYRIHPVASDGTRLTLECITKLRAFEDGERFILSVLSDVTKLEERTEELNRMNVNQEKMLAEIQKERQQYRDALVSGSEYAYQFDVTEGMVYSDFEYSIRGSMQEKWGVTAPISFDELSKHWFEMMKPQFLTPKEQNPMTSAEIKECYDRGFKHIVTEYFLETENKYYRRTFLLSTDEERGHLFAIAITNDISDIMRAETRKRNELTMINRDLRNQINISKAFSSIYFASWEIDLETRQITQITVPEWADQVQEMSEGDFEKAAEIMITSFVKIEWRDDVRQFIHMDDMAERLKNESILSCECQVHRYGWSTANLIPSMRDENGNVLRVILAVREIGNEKRKELEAKQALEEAYAAANRANAAKTDFLSSVSHDIRTPMNGIIGMTTIASAHLDDKERVADCLNKISTSSKHLLGLINEVLDMNKIESGKLDLNVEQFPLSELIDTLLVMSRPQIEAKRHELSVSTQNIEHELVIGDSLRLQQVFVNLLSNAIKYTPKGGHIQLSLSEKPTNNPKIGCFEFVVEDNGIGMSEEYLKQLFEPFSRANDKRIAKIQGSGLGMAIARNIVRMMNGDIQVESELSKGTKFTVTIYLELQETEDNISLDSFRNLPILVVDDDQMVCENICSLLDSLGMKGEWVLTGEEAIEKIRVRHEKGDDYFSVILDWKMPCMDGVTTARKIREQIGDKLHIVIISAYDWSDIEQEAKDAGVNAFTTKPIFKSRIAYLFKNLVGQGSETPNSPEPKDLSEVDYTGKRALLAEDNELNAEIAQELLGVTGLAIEHALNGQEAVDFLTNHPEGYYDIVFMDVQMPIMNGYEATRTIRSLPSAYAKKIPIIAMTANAFAEDVQAAKNAGMNEHIAKPLNIAQLIKALERWMK